MTTESGSTTSSEETTSDTSKSSTYETSYITSATSDTRALSSSTYPSYPFSAGNTGPQPWLGVREREAFPPQKQQMTPKKQNNISDETYDVYRYMTLIAVVLLLGSAIFYTVFVYGDTSKIIATNEKVIADLKKLHLAQTVPAQPDSENEFQTGQQKSTGMSAVFNSDTKENNKKPLMNDS